MTARRPRSDSPKPKRPGIQLQAVAGTSEFELVFPRCVQQRAADMEEIRKMLEAGEVDVAVDELRWLLGECHELLEAHKLLGEIAVSDGDLELGRAHLGYAYDLGDKALPKGRLPGTLPYARPANRSFLEAAKGLAWCLNELGDPTAAKAVVRRLLELDPSDPLEVTQMLPG